MTVQAQDLDEPTDQRLAYIRERHRPLPLYPNEPQVRTVCVTCAAVWPCEVGHVLALLDGTPATPATTRSDHEPDSV